MKLRTVGSIAATGLVALLVAVNVGHSQGQGNCLGCDEDCCWHYDVGYTQCTMDVAAPGCGSYCTDGKTECPMSDDDNLLASLDGVAYFTSDAEADGVQAVQKTAAANEASALRSFMTCGGVIVGRLYAPHVAAYLRRATTTIVV